MFLLVCICGITYVATLNKFGVFCLYVCKTEESLLFSCCSCFFVHLNIYCRYLCVLYMWLHFVVVKEKKKCLGNSYISSCNLNMQ